MEDKKILNNEELEKVVGGLDDIDTNSGYFIGNRFKCECGGNQSDCPFCRGTGYVPDPNDPRNYIDGIFIWDIDTEEYKP